MSLFYKVLGKKTFEEKDRLRMEFLKQLLALQQILIKRPEDYAKKVASDFYFNSVAVLRKDGSVIMANNDENGNNGSIDFLNSVRSKFRDAHFMLVKENGHCNVIYSDDDLIYTFKAPGEISAIEAQAAARNLKKTIEKYRLNRRENKIHSKVAM